MARFLFALVAILTCSVLTSTAFGTPKGWYVGGGAATQDVTGDVDGKAMAVSDKGDRGVNLGKFDSTRSGSTFNGGYSVNTHFAWDLQFIESRHSTSHRDQGTQGKAALATLMPGIRVSANLGEYFDVFARIAIASSILTYDRFGLIGTTSGGIFTTQFHSDASLSGAGYGYGAGAEIIFGRHLGVVLGVTNLALRFDSADIGGKTAQLKKSVEVNSTAKTAAVLWHF